MSATTHKPETNVLCQIFKSEVTHRAESGDSTHQTGGGEQCRGADGDVDTQRYEEPRVAREQVLSQCTAGVSAAKFEGNCCSVAADKRPDSRADWAG